MGTDGKRSRLHLRGLHWYSSQAGTELRRRPTDIVLLAACLLGLLLLAPSAPGPTPFDSSMATAVQSLPSWFSWLFPLGYAVAALWALLLVVVPLVTPHRQSVAGLLVLAAVIAFGLAGLAGVLAGTGWDESWRAMWSPDPPPVYTAVRVATITAVIVASSPHLSRPLRMLGRVLIVVVATCTVGLGIAYPIGAFAALLIGVAAAAVVHLLLGSPAGRPSTTRVADALDDLGLPQADVTALAIPAAGQSLFAARVEGHPDLVVTVLGRDEWDAQALASVWTAATRRGEHVDVTTTRLARVEHAAMMTLMAERAGVRVLPVVVAGRSAEGDAVLVTHAPGGAALGDMSPRDVTDALLDEAWNQVRLLHKAGIAHGRIDGSRILLDVEGQLALTDFGDAELVSDRRDLMFDRARLLAATALATDASRAVASAKRVIGTDGLVELLPFLQPAVLDRETRAKVDDGEWDLKALRATASTAAGVDVPALEQLRRVSVRSLLQTAIIVFLSYTLISLFSGVDFSEVWADLQTADWSWLFLALLVSPLAQGSFAFSTLGATTASLRYYPVLMLQFALQFIAVALPATAARIAMDVRFFQSFGVASGAAVSIGMIDSFSGFVVQVALLAVILLSGLPGFTQPLLDSSSSSSDSSSDSSTPSLLALTFAIALVSLIVVLVVPKLRRRFSDRMRVGWTAFVEQARNAKGALEVLRRPSKVLEMLLGNLGGQVVQAIVLGLCLHAFGQDAALSQLILINTAVSLFAGLMPVPGGVGVAEAGLTAGLQGIGIPSSIAISTAIAFRLVTFYLPPLWGSVAMRWLRKHSYV